jgi:lysophospholipase L1-like esterase
MKIMKPANFSRRTFFLLLTALGLMTGLAWAAEGPTNQATGSRLEKTVRVACVGDSITFGSGLANRQQDAYPAVLGRWLGSGWDVRNFGVSGATLLNEGDKPYARETAHRDALAFAPDIVVIMLGTNDSKHPGDDSLGPDNHVDNWQYHERYLPEYEELIQEFRRANPEAKIYVCLPTPCFPGRWGISDRTIHEEVIPSVREAAQSANARIIDLNTPFAGKASLFPDTVHPDSAGAKLMAAIVYQTLTKRPAPASAP